MVAALVVALAGGGPQLGAVLVADRGVLAAVVALVVVLDAAVVADLTLGGRRPQLAAVAMRCWR